MKKRSLSKFEVHIIHLCHHDFGGLSIKKAAEKTECSPETIETMLKEIKQKCPQLFPILTPQHQAILLMYDKHMSRASIAAALGISEQGLNKKMAFLRRYKFLLNRKPVRYEPLMDSRVKVRF